MAYTLGTLSTVWAVASAVAIGALGLGLLSRRDVRPRGWLPFGLFATVWAVQISAINLGGLVSSQGTASLLFLVSIGALIPQAYFLVEFAAAHADGPRRSTGWRGVRYGTAALAVIASGLFALRPTLFLEGVQSGAAFYPTWGPLFVGLAGIPPMIAVPVALVVLHRSFRTAPTARTQRFSVFMAAGLALYASFNAASNLAFFLPPGIEDPLSTSGAYTLALGATALVCLGLGLATWQRARTAPTDAETRHHRWLAGAYLVPLVLGTVEGIAATTVFGGLNTVGLWRLAGVAVIAYGLARWRTPDLPERVREVSANASGAAGALATGATAFGAGSLLTGGLAVPLLVGVGTTGVTAVPALRWARRLFGAEGDNPVDEAEQRYEQRIETYRAALEDSMARDTLDEDEPFLTDLRERFGITEREDRILRYYARKATVPRREGDPDTAYERLRIVGEGGAGRVWLARDRSRDRLVVLKEPLERWHEEPAVLEAARREARLAAKVRHPNVVEIEEVLEDEGRPVLVMEHVVGGSLADRLRDQGTLAPREAMRVVHDAAQGLAAVHDAGLVHRDLTPDNILLDEDGTAMITDFGLARPQKGSGTQLLDDEAGSEGYKAPEAARGSNEPPVDVYGLAAVLHTCLYGSPPLESTVQVEADVPEDLDALVQTGLATDPGDRFEDARAFAEALEEVVEP